MSFASQLLNTFIYFTVKSISAGFIIRQKDEKIPTFKKAASPVLKL